MPDLVAQVLVEVVALNDARCGAAIGNRVWPATGDLADRSRMPSSRSIAMIFSGELPSVISMRAKWTLTPSGTTPGYHSSTTMLTLGTMTPSRTASVMLCSCGASTNSSEGYPCDTSYHTGEASRPPVDVQRARTPRCCQPQ